MIEVYKIIQGHYDPEASTIIKLMNDTEQRYRDRPFNLQGGLWFFISFRNFFPDNTRDRIFFSSGFNIRFYDKNSASDYYFFPAPKLEYFFSNIGNQNILLEKKNITPPLPFKLNGRSLSTRTNSKKVVYNRANTNIRQNSFSIRIAKYRNTLPENIVNAPSINSFKNRLDKHWKDEELYYANYKADISGSRVTYREIEEI
jgi:hypothetical protein